MQTTPAPVPDVRPSGRVHPRAADAPRARVPAVDDLPAHAARTVAPPDSSFHRPCGSAHPAAGRHAADPEAVPREASVAIRYPEPVQTTECVGGRVPGVLSRGLPCPDVTGANASVVDHRAFHTAAGFDQWESAGPRSEVGVSRPSGADPRRIVRSADISDHPRERSHFGWSRVLVSVLPAGYGTTISADVTRDVSCSDVAAVTHPIVPPRVRADPFPRDVDRIATPFPMIPVLHGHGLSDEPRTAHRERDDPDPISAYSSPDPARHAVVDRPRMEAPVRS